MGMVTFALFILFFSIESKDERDSAFSLDTFPTRRSLVMTGVSFVCWSVRRPGHLPGRAEDRQARRPAVADLHRGGPVDRGGRRDPQSGAAADRRAAGDAGSAGDLEFVADVDDAAGHQRGADHRVVFGPGADMTGQRDDAVLGVRLHVAAVGDQRGAVQCLLDVQVDVDRIDGVADLDVVEDVADAGQPATAASAAARSVR